MQPDPQLWSPWTVQRSAYPLARLDRPAIVPVQAKAGMSRVASIIPLAPLSSAQRAEAPRP